MKETMDKLRAQFVALPVLTQHDPDDAYGVNDVDYIPRKEALALLDRAALSSPAQETPKVEPVAWLVEDLHGINRPPIFATIIRKHVEGVYSDPTEFKVTPLFAAQTEGEKP